MSFGLSHLRGEERLDILGETSSSGLQGMEEEGSLRVGEGRHWRVNQPLPRPCKYRGLGAKKFGSFRKNFEAYAGSMWGSNKEGWKIGLEAMLEGHPLALYQSYIEQDLSYDTIADRLSGIFTGESDPFLCRKLLKLRTISKGTDENWIVFVSRCHNLLCEIYPDITDEDRQIRLREVVLQKMDSGVLEKVVQICMIKEDFSPATVFTAVNTLDSIPPEMMGGKGMGVEEVLNFSTYVRSEGAGNKTCLYCGSTSHFMADCVRYMKTKDQGVGGERLNIYTGGQGAGNDRISKHCLFCGASTHYMIECVEYGRMGEGKPNEEMLNMAVTKGEGGPAQMNKINQRHCFYCGMSNHFMSNCYKYKRLCSRCSELESGFSGNSEREGGRGEYYVRGDYDNRRDNNRNQGQGGNDRRNSEREGGRGEYYERGDYDNRRDNNRNQGQRGNDRRNSEREANERSQRGGGGNQGGQPGRSNMGNGDQGRWGWSQGTRGRVENNTYEVRENSGNG